MQKPVDMRSPVFSYDGPRTSFVEGLASVLDLGGALSREDVAEFAASQWVSWLTSHGILTREVLRDGQLVAPFVGVKPDAEAAQDYWLTVGRYVQNAMGEGYKTVLPADRPSITLGK